MAEYIERKELLKFLRKQAGEAQEIAEEYGGESIVYADCIEDVLEDVERFPAADVAPIRHGRWTFGKNLPDAFGSIAKNRHHLFCSECKNQAFNNSIDDDPDFDVDSDFCPNCGARMDGAE